MRPVTRSTSTHPPLCHNHCGVASSGKLSFTRNARRTTNSRSVTSCGLPIVNSFSLPSTYSARTLSSNGVFSSVPASHLTCVDLPNVITCGLAAAIAAPAKTIMLHNTHVVLDMLAVITNRWAKRKVRDHNQWFGRCLTIPPVKSILETTADLGIAVLHRGGRAAIHGRVAQHERMSPFRAGPAGLKLGDLLNLLRGSKEPLFHLTRVRMAWSETTLCKAEPARGLWKSGHLWPRCATRKTVALQGRACRAKARRSTESLMRALKGTPWYSSELDHARSHCDGHHLHGSRVFITCPSEFRSNILHYNRNLETHTFIP